MWLGQSEREKKSSRCVIKVAIIGLASSETLNAITLTLPFIQSFKKPSGYFEQRSVHTVTSLLPWSLVAMLRTDHKGEYVVMENT
jgi:hypothetical protein